MIDEVVDRFEPRLRDVAWSLIVDADDKGRSQGASSRSRRALHVDPSPEVAFETILELTTGQASIQRGR